MIRSDAIGTLDAAFQKMHWIFGVYLLMVILYAVFSLPGYQRAAISIAIINHGGLIGFSAILVVPFISPFPLDLRQMLIGVLVECFCAFVFLMSSIEIIRFFRKRAVCLLDQSIIVLIFLRLIFFALNYIASGGQYGIFSDDSRIDFLTTNPLIARTWYIDMIIDFILSGSILTNFIKEGRFRRNGVFGLLAMVAISILTGSKGVTFLVIGYSLLYIYVAFPANFRRVSTLALLMSSAVFLLIAVTYIYIIGQITQVSFLEQLQLTFSRFLLSADARIMAFDPNVNGFILSHPHGSLLAELFRGPARALGFTVAEYSMGIYQYQYEANSTSYIGSTNQLSAMFMIYGGSLWYINFILVASLMWFVYKIFAACMRSGNSAVSWVGAASLFHISDTFCKGFEAYVQLVPICGIIVIGVTLFSKIFKTRRF